MPSPATVRSDRATTTTKSLVSTASARRGHSSSFITLGRLALRLDARCATTARYPRRPPLVLTSRDTVEGALPSRRAIERNDSFPASPLEISSRSAIDNRNERHSTRGLRRLQPDETKRVRIVDGDRPSRRLIDRCDSPASHQSHKSSRSTPDNPSTAHLHRDKTRSR